MVLVSTAVLKNPEHPVERERLIDRLKPPRKLLDHLVPLIARRLIRNECVERIAYGLPDVLG